MASTITTLKHLQIPLEEVLKATNNFDEEYVIGGGDFGKVYRGQLLVSGEMVDIAARRLDTKHRGGGVEFWTEISVLSGLDHENIFSLIGFCDENGEKIIINKDEATKGSLSMYLSDPTTLTWIHRLNICVGVARALRYIHNGEGLGSSVIHRNINSYTVLLDAKFEVKLSGFEYSIKQSVNRMDRVVLSEAVGTKGYMDPSIVKTRGVSHKSDIYSFGVVLCEILCGRKAFIPNHVDNRFLAPLFIYHYENRSLNDIIHPDLRHQMTRRSLTRLSEVAYSCLKEDRVQRPKMNNIVIELERAFELQQPLENLIQNMEHLKIPLGDIMLATDNFSEEYHIGYNDCCNLYIAEIVNFEEHPSFKEGKNKDELPRRHKTVVIKRILPSEDDPETGEEMFYTEIKMLHTCKHPSIVKLIGFSNEGSEMILVVEHLSNGNLLSYWKNTDMRQVLTWAKRLKICLDVANALNYLHTEMEEQKTIIHRDIKSCNIALDENFGAKIIDFRRSIFLPPNDDSILHNIIPGTRYFIDPEYRETGKLKRESDVYNFGVVLIEFLCGKSASDPMYLKDGEQGMAIMARRCFQEGTPMEMMDPTLKEESCENSVIPKGGPNKDSFEKFVKIAHQCIAHTQDRRPTMKVVIRELQKALFFQEEHLDIVHVADAVEESMELKLSRENSKDERQCPDMVQDVDGIKESMELKLTNALKLENSIKESKHHLKIPLSDILLATDNFSKAYKIGGDRYYNLYTTKLKHFDTEIPSIKEGKTKSNLSRTRNTVVIKRYPPRKDDIGEETFITEIKMLDTCKHPSIVKLLGFCVEDSEMILVIEHLPNGYLEDYWKNLNLRPFLTWEKRLKICLDVANALNYLHYEMEDHKTIIHRDIKSYYIALDENWGAKIVDFRYSVFLPPNQDGDALYHNSYIGTREYIDPEYRGTGKLKRESDVYGFGVVLFEVLCGRLAYDPIYLMESEQGLAFVARRCSREGTLIEMIDPILKEPRGENDFILNRGPNKYSLKKFVNIAHECIAETQDRRPTIKVVIQELQDALFFQEEEEHLDMLHVADEVEESMELTFSPDYAVKEEHLDMVHVVDEVEESMELTFTPDYAIKKLENLKIPLSDILLATENFSLTYRIVPTSYPYLEFYRAELKHFDIEKPSIKEEENKSDMCRTCNTVVIERFRPRNQIEIDMFYTEFKMLNTCKHPNIIKLLGFCVEDSEMIVVVEHLSNGYLYDYWKNTDMRHTLTWEKRLKICLDVANALNYIHTEMEDQKAIIHRSIMSYNIELDENWGAKVIGFQVSVFLPPNQDDDTLYQSFRSGVLRYRDPEYWETGKLKRESDVYSFGVVLFEVLCGRLAYDPIYLNESDEFGLAFVARRCFQEGTLTEMIDPILKEQRGEKSLTLNRGPNKDSLEKFVNVAHECIATTQDKRPTMNVVIQELQDALFFQENNKDEPKISLEVIRLATKNFDDENCIGRGGFGKVYKGEVPQGDRLSTIIVAKRLDTRLGQGEQQFRNEIQILFEYKHENIISLVGYCDEEKEKIIVYEYASQGSLNSYLKDVRLTWVKRLDICIDVATALAFLHGGAGKQAIMIHRDIKTENILLINDEWDAKLADFGLSLISPINRETDYVIDHACGTRGYLDPLYLKSGFLTKESDIYSFGVVLFEIMCGRSTFEIRKHEGQYLPDFIKESFKKGKGKHDDLVFEDLKKQMVPEALTAFQTIAYKCLHDDREKRPTAKEVLQQLKEAREFQRQAMREHDEALQKLNGTEISTKPIALAVNEEPDLHTRLIDDLDEHVEITDDLAGFCGCFEAISRLFCCSFTAFFAAA